MSAREELRRYVHLLADMWTSAEVTDERVERLYATVRSEVLAQDGQEYTGELAMLRGLVATLRVVAVHSDLPEVRQLLDEHKRDDADARAEREKSSPAGADATPGLSERQARLLDAIRTHGGEWTTRRVLHLFALTDPGVVQRGTARRDLAALHRAGHLVLVDDPDKRHYALNTMGGGR